jgi:hypothetical protein
MKRKSASPIAPASLVAGKTSQEAIGILIKQIDRWELRAAGLLIDDADPDPEETAVVVGHLDALRAELLRQGKREAALN